MNAVSKAKLRKAEEASTPVDAKAPPQTKGVTITRPNFQEAVIPIIGTTPLVIHAFSQKVQNTIRETQEAGSQSKKGKARVARDFEANFNDARHISVDGWDGFAASAIRNALVSACRIVGFKMTLAKLSLFCVADGFDAQGTGLVRIIGPAPTCDIRPGRNANGGIDLRARPMWQAGWRANIRLRWDADQFSASDIANLLARVGQQVGIGEGRPDSRMSTGVGWGEFRLDE
jgi:hypothetical protein